MNVCSVGAGCGSGTPGDSTCVYVSEKRMVDAVTVFLCCELGGVGRNTTDKMCGRIAKHNEKRAAVEIE